MTFYPPPPPQNPHPLASLPLQKRRSNRQVKRKKYTEDLDIKITDDEEDEELDVTGPVRSEQPPAPQPPAPEPEPEGETLPSMQFFVVGGGLPLPRPSSSPLGFFFILPLFWLQFSTSFPGEPQRGGRGHRGQSPVHEGGQKGGEGPPLPPLPPPPLRRPHGLGEEEGLLPDVNVPICSSLQLPSGQFTESEEFFVKYKN